MVKIRKQLASTKNTYGSGNTKKYITIHETANTSKGANAAVHANLQSNGFSASWHYTVDDREAVQSFDHNIRCWHAGTTEGNNQSIGIETCVNSDGDFKKAVENLADLVKKIMKDEGIPLSRVVQHNHWSGKNCPTNLRNGSKGIDWDDFKQMVGGSKGSYTPPKKQTGSKTVSGGSIVDYMKSKGMDSSFGNRSKLAKKYGINNYKGTASQNNNLLSKLKSGKPKKKGNTKTNSIVEYLKSIGVNSSFSNRSKLAKQYGISGYKGTASQNTRLLNAMRKGGSKSKKKGNMQTSSVVDYLKSIGEDSSFNNRSRLARKYGISNYKGTASQNAQLLKKLRG